MKFLLNFKIVLKYSLYSNFQLFVFSLQNLKALRFVFTYHTMQSCGKRGIQSCGRAGYIIYVNGEGA